MKPMTACALLIAAACSGPGSQSSVEPSEPVDQETALHELADSILAAARARDANRFAGFFSNRPDFVYLINTRHLTSRDTLRDTFARMLERQQRFEPVWRTRHVQILSADIDVVTGLFDTSAQQQTGEEWQASGVVTFVAMREPDGWRVVNWHTTE
ncbi:MAG TPA: SgcJ/EcaC family oxidoreductase [Longimicrobiales bacterium]